MKHEMLTWPDLAVLAIIILLVVAYIATPKDRRDDDELF